MKRELISDCIKDAMLGDLLPLNNLIEHLLTRKKFTVKQLCEFSEKYYGIPKQTALDTIKYFQ